MGCVCMHVSAFDLDFSWFLVEAWCVDGPCLKQPHPELVSIFTTPTHSLATCRLCLLCVPILWPTLLYPIWVQVCGVHTAWLYQWNSRLIILWEERGHVDGFLFIGTIGTTLAGNAAGFLPASNLTNWIARCYSCFHVWVEYAIAQASWTTDVTSGHSWITHKSRGYRYNLINCLVLLPTNTVRGSDMITLSHVFFCGLTYKTCDGYTFVAQF